MTASSIALANILKISTGKVLQAEDMLAVEEPLEIRVQYRTAGRQLQHSISVTMRTPGHDPELAAGFLFTEGIIQYRQQVTAVTPHPLDPQVILVTLSEGSTPFLSDAARNFYTTSGCGICGKASIEAIKTVSVYDNEFAGPLTIPEAVFYQLQEQLGTQQKIFKSTGGLHAAALFDTQGNFLNVREDVGRHNALDKLIGAAFLQEELPLSRQILLLSGRASFELIQKATMAGIRIVAAVGAPSSLAVETAAAFGITLAGFLRPDRFNIYTHPCNIITS